MEMLKILNQPGWDYRLTHGGITINAPSKKEASIFARTYAEALTETAAKFNGSVRVGWRKCKQPLEFHNWMIGGTQSLKDFLQSGGLGMNSLNFPGLYLGSGIKIYTREFLQILLDLLDRKESIGSMVRLSDNAQLILTQASAATIGLNDPTTDSEPYVSLKREDYWQPQNLIDFNREWQQVLNEDGSNTLEHTYLALADPVGDQVDRLNWLWVTNRFRLVRDGNTYYHQAELLDLKPAPKPVIVR